MTESVNVEKCSNSLGNYTRFLILVISTVALTFVMANSLALNFTVICMMKEPAIHDSNFIKDMDKFKNFNFEDFHEFDNLKFEDMDEFKNFKFEDFNGFGEWNSNHRELRKSNFKHDDDSGESRAFENNNKIEGVELPQG